MAGLLALGLLGATRFELTPGGEGLRLAATGWVVPELCAVRRATGRPCPGCGAGRAFVLTLRGEAARAWRLHPRGVLLAVWAGAQAAGRALLALPWPWRPSARFVVAEVGISLAALLLLSLPGGFG